MGERGAITKPIKEFLADERKKNRDRAAAAKRTRDDPRAKQRKADEERVKGAVYRAFWAHKTERNGGDESVRHDLAAYERIRFFDLYGEPPRVNERGKLDGEPENALSLLREAVRRDCLTKIRQGRTFAKLGVKIEPLHAKAAEWFPELVEEHAGIEAEIKKGKRND